MQEEKKENNAEKIKKRNGAKFAGAFLVTCMMAASFFFFWAWISYEKKLSAEVIRAGLRLLEEDESQLMALQSAIGEGLDSGINEGFDPKAHLKSLKAEL